MSEKTDLHAALGRIESRWDGERTARTLPGARHKLHRRVRRARVLGSATALAVLGAVGVWALGSREPQHAAGTPAQHTARAVAAVSAPEQIAATTSQRLQLADGSEVALLDANARVVVKEVSATRTSVELAHGRARFDVAHREERLFRILCGEVTVEVLGTAFELERVAERTHVAVTRGRVAVAWSSGRAELSAGEAGWFPRPAAPEPSAALPTVVAPSPSHAATKPSPAAARGTWQAPAEQGNFARAYELLARAKQPLSDDVEELMLAADTARLSGHPGAALPFLSRVVERHAQDARAPLAAFTLGGVLMQQLGRPREALTAYARARELAPDSSLAQDALARQVEAAHRAGDAEAAAGLAAEYLERYPQGRRVHAVRRFGGVASP